MAPSTIERPDTGLVRTSGRRESSFFSLEMTPAGVSLKLDRAFTRLPAGVVSIGDLALSVPWVGFPFDYTSGPRSLQSQLSCLESVSVQTGYEFVAAMCGLSGRFLDVSAEPGPAGDSSVVIGGTVDSIPFSVRMAFAAAGAGEIAVQFSRPRVFGLGSSVSWADIPRQMMASVRTAFSAGQEGTSSRIPFVRSVLKPIMTGLGFKLPLMDDTVLKDVVAGHAGLRFDFGRSTASSSSGSGLEMAGDTESAFADPSRLLSDLMSGPDGGRNAERVTTFIESAVAWPVLWPEVLARALETANEHPEQVSPLLAAVLTGSENPDWMDDHDLQAVCRRLLSAVESEGCRTELVRCCDLVSSLVDRFEPREALSLLDGMRSAGVENRAVLEAVAVTLDRLGRHTDASTTRLRALAMAAGRQAPDAVRSIVDRMDVNGFAQQASIWLKELAGLCARGRFGTASDSLGRIAVILMASREALSDRETSWQMLKQILDSRPGDIEVLELMLALAREKHEISEVVEHFTDAAALSGGRERCQLLFAAGRAVLERFGLKRKASELLASAVESDPGCSEASELLDSIYESLGRYQERVHLARRRLEGAAGPADRRRILAVLMKAAEDAGMTDDAEEAVRALLRLDPADLALLESAARIFEKSGNSVALRETLEAIEDLSGTEAAVGPGTGLEELLAAGDPAAAVEMIAEGLGSISDERDFSERAFALADLCVLCAGPEFERAVEAVRVCAAPLPTERRRIIADCLCGAADAVSAQRPVEAMTILETALILDPDDQSTLMALAAVYEALGMAQEAEALVGASFPVG